MINILSKHLHHIIRNQNVKKQKVTMLPTRKSPDLLFKNQNSRKLQLPGLEIIVAFINVYFFNQQGIRKRNFGR